MSAIQFSHDRFFRIREVYGDWWAGKSRRPIAGAVFFGAPTVKEPKVPFLTQATVNLETPVDGIIDAIEYEYSKYSFYGDAYPYFPLDCFGPSIVAAFMGASYDNSSGQVWIGPSGVGIEDIRFTYNPEHVWFRRICEIIRRGNERFEGRLMFGMPDLGGPLDILSLCVNPEELFLAMFDNAELVKGLLKELFYIWQQYYDAFSKELNSAALGYTDWTGIYSEKPSYALQSDFSYNLGPDMFREFALPDIKRGVKAMKNAMYHLDGINQLRFLDTILCERELKAVQWVPGEGQAPVTKWPHVYKKIAEAGKRIQVVAADFQMFDEIREQVQDDSKLLLALGLPWKKYPESEKANVFAHLKHMHIEL